MDSSGGVKREKSNERVRPDVFGNEKQADDYLEAKEDC